MRLATIIMTFCLSACAAVPTQLKTAMDVQKTEIANVKDLYRINVNQLLDSVEKYRIAILDLLESAKIAEYSKSLDEVNGTVEETDPTGDPNVDHVKLSTLKLIQVFFNEKRDDVRQDIRARRVQYDKIADNFDNIESVNRAVTEYIASLERLKNSRDAAAQGLLQKVTGLTSLPINLSDLPDPATLEDLAEKFQPK